MGNVNCDNLSDADQWIERLQLIRHPEGGYYRETYRSEVPLPQTVLPAGFETSRRLSTAIYYLLRADEFSTWHRLRSDEIWHFYAGSPILLYGISCKGQLTVHRLGNLCLSGELPQVLVPAGQWIAAKVLRRDSFSLVGCTVAPGFEFQDFEIGRREDLLRLFPDLGDLIRAMTWDGDERD